MEQITIRLREDTLEEIEAEADEHGKSRSEHIRDVLASRRDVNELREKVNRLRNEKRQVLEQREEKTQLANYVEEEQSWRRAPITQRVKWWLFGKGSS